MNLGGQPNFAIIFQSPSRLTVSIDLVRSTNVIQSCLAVKIVSIVPLSLLNPQRLSVEVQPDQDAHLGGPIGF